MKNHPLWLDFNAFLAEFTYKPNFTFVHFEQDGRPWLRVSMYVEDSRKPFDHWQILNMNEQFEYVGSMYNPFRNRLMVDEKEVILVEGNYIIPDFGPGMEEMFKHFLIGCIHKIEDHEMYEWLRYKGELIDDPHKKD